MILAIVAVSACAGGPRYGDVRSSLPQLDPDKARIFFFRQAHFAGHVATLRVQIDGNTVGELPNGSLFRIDRAPGDLKIRFEREGILGFGHVDFPLTVEAGKEYYVELGGRPPTYCDQFVVGAVGCAMQPLMAKTDMLQKDYCGADGWCAGIRDKDAALPKLNELTVENP